MARPKKYTAEELNERKKAQRLAWYAKNRTKVLAKYAEKHKKPAQYLAFVEIKN